MKSYVNKLFFLSILSLFVWPSFVGAYNTWSDSSTGSLSSGSLIASWSVVVTATWNSTLTATWNNTTSGVSMLITSNFNQSNAWLGVPEDPELIEALAWMYTNSITSLGTPSTYRPFDKITREESTKIIGRFAKNILNKQPNPNLTTTCIFLDSWMIAQNLLMDVTDSCKMWLFRWWNGWFYPKGGLTKAQSIVVLIRLFDNKIYTETSDPRFKTYYDRAYELGITKDRDLTNFNRDVTRYEIALMIYRFHIKYKLLKINNGLLLPHDQFTSILSGSVVEVNGLKKWSALFNTDILTNPDVDSFPIDLFGDKYLIKKRKMDNYGVGNNNYIRFGDLYTSDGQSYLGSVSFTVLNGMIDEAYIRPTELWKKYYTIKPSTQQPYYSIEEKLAN